VHFWDFSTATANRGLTERKEQVQMQALNGTPQEDVQAKSLVRSDDAAGLCKKINICIEKAETAAKKAGQFYTSAAIYIRDLQAKFPKTWQLLLKERCGFGRSRAYEILAIADGRKTAEGIRAETAARVKRHTDQQGKNPLADGRSRATTPLQWVTADCKDESGLQGYEAKLPRNHRYAVIPRAEDRRYDVMFDRTYLSFHAPTAEVGKAIAEAHYAGRGLESAGSPQAPEPVPVETTIIGNQADEPKALVEDPAIVLNNVLDSIKQSKAVAEAYRKILKVSPFDREAKKQISDGIESLSRNWRSVQSTLVANAPVESSTTLTVEQLALAMKKLGAKAVNAAIDLVPEVKTANAKHVLAQHKRPYINKEMTDALRAGLDTRTVPAIHAAFSKIAMELGQLHLDRNDISVVVRKPSDAAYEPEPDESAPTSRLIPGGNGVAAAT
jgi:hypothetical protein